MLVRPSESSAVRPTSKTELPEKALAREATGLPKEVAAANGMGKAPGANGTNHTNGANGANGSNGQGPGAGAKNNGKGPGASAARGVVGGTTRATPGGGRSQAGTGKGSSAARRRGNRPKGGK